MKVNLIIGLVVVVFLTAGPIPVAAYTIDDSPDGPNTYWGGILNPGAQYPSRSDVIGCCDVTGMEVTKNGNIMTVKLFGPYFSDPNFQYGAGDLFISSTGWRKTTSDFPHYPSDTFTSTEGWNYVVRKFGRVAEVDRLDFSSILWTAPTYDGNGGRANQAYKGGYGQFVEDATITQDDVNHMLIFEFSVDGSAADSFLRNSDKVGFHWSMSCGNDVVEGEVSLVPEPGTMLLLGGGLIALGVLRRKFTN